jgi:hypothetical protein
LTCRYFDSLAKPILFRTFSVPRPGPERWGIDSKQFTERLSFWLSDSIAHFIQHCHVPYADSPHIKAFFDNILVFSNLQHLDLQSTVFDDHLLEQLRALRPLKHLTISDCIITATQPIRSPLQVARLELINRSRTTMEWLKIVQFTGIPHISFALYGDGTERVLRTIVDMVALPILDSVEVLGTADIIHFLTSNPLYTSQIRSLVFRPPKYGTERLAGPPYESIEMPFLHHYSGPFQFLVIFKLGRALRTLFSSPWQISADLPPCDDAHTFHSLTQCTELEVVSIRVVHVTLGLLEAIFSRCSHLKSLIVQFTLGECLGGHASSILFYLVNDLYYCLLLETDHGSWYTQSTTKYPRTVILQSTHTTYHHK